VQVDLTESATIRPAAADIESQEGPLDILVNNAGVSTLGDGSPGVASLEAVRRTVDTNFSGSFAVTQAGLVREPIGFIQKRLAIHFESCPPIAGATA
jgi:NAD(P)-dependent dehydrogenase (short-subunit alcohol dehydrogenase family)